MTDELLRANIALFNELRSGVVYTHIEEGQLGRFDMDGVTYLGDPTTGVDLNYLWVRLGISGRALTRALIGAGVVPYCHINGKRVWVGLNRNGELTAFEVINDQQEAAVNPGQTTNPDADNRAKRHELITGGRVLPRSDTDTPGLTVYVEPFPIAGIIASINAQDISADEPANPGEYGWSVVYVLDGVVSSAASAAYLLPSAAALLVQTALDTALPAGAFRLWAVSLYNGETDILASNTRLEDLRDWLTPTDAGSLSVTDGITTVTPVTSINFTSGATVIDAGGGEADVDVTGGSGGGELGYAASTSLFSTASTTLVDVTGVTVAVTVGTRPIKITFYCPLIIRTAGLQARAHIAIVEGSTELGGAYMVALGVDGDGNVNIVARLAPTAGSHTYKVQMDIDNGSGATVELYAGSTTPMFILVEEL